jgi:hypothetical protein
MMVISPAFWLRNRYSRFPCVQAAVTDSQNIAHLTAAVFTAAFEPVKKQIEAMQKPPCIKPADLFGRCRLRGTPSLGCCANKPQIVN